MRRTAAVAVTAVAVLFLILAWPGSPAKEWLLSFLAGRPRVQTNLVPRAKADTPGPVLRIAIGAMISPERTLDHYGRFFEAFARSIGHSAEIIQRRTYLEVNQLILDKKIDLAWLCTGAWIELHQKHAARLLAVPVVGGKVTYQALIIANSGTKAEGILGLRGRRFAFTDPVSLTGCKYPRRLVRESGEEPSTFFSTTTFTHGHDTSVEAVRRGFADAASVDSLVYEYLEKLSPEEVAGIRIVHRSVPFPIPPLAVPAGTTDAEFVELQQALIGFSKSEEGRNVLLPILVERFAVPDEGSYRELE